MEKEFLKRRLPDLIIVEGFWQVGKSSLIKKISESRKTRVISEPDHLTAGVTSNISSWYEIEHKKRLAMAKDFLRLGEKVVMERSAISSIAYKYAMFGKISKSDIGNILKFKKFNNCFIYFLYGRHDFILNFLDKIKNMDTKILLRQSDFYRRYLYFYKNILTKHLNNVVLIKVDRNCLFKEVDEVFKEFYLKLPLLDKSFEVCSSIVPFYGDEVLLLYDKNCKHYVLPQGHREEGESLRQTAAREMVEETGFSEVTILGKLTRYQYHYPKKDKIVYKTIHVFLAKIDSLAKVKKTLQSHECFINKFFSGSEAVDIAKWPQDKLVIKMALGNKKTPSRRKRVGPC